MGPTITDDEINKVMSFHGHRCPGIAIGIRVAELCLRELGHNNQSPIVAICETDMCGIDAIQFLTGCTVGKGNLLFKDYGKMAFTFFRRNDGKGFRALLNPDFAGQKDPKMDQLMKKIRAETATEFERDEYAALRAKSEQRYLTADLDTLFTIMPPQMDIPRPAKGLQSLCCENCGEKTMESRTRRFDGKDLCIPCFQKVEQKI